jgi:energy-coupling factor transport system substrate-specific component
VFAIIITLNDFLAAAVIGPPLLFLLYPRIKDAGLRYTDIMEADALADTSPQQRQVAAAGLVGVSILWLFVGILIGVVLLGIPFGVPAGGVELGTGGSTVQAAVGAVAFVLLLGFSVLTGFRVPQSLLGSGESRTPNRRN